MSEPTMTGDEAGIRLWNRMNSAKDELEAAYARSVANAAQAHGKVWYSDCVAQRNTGANQTMYQMTWDATTYGWVVSQFLVPDSTPVSPPKVQYDDIEIEVSDDGWEQINADDVIIV